MNLCDDLRHLQLEGTPGPQAGGKPTAIPARHASPLEGWIAELLRAEGLRPEVYRAVPLMRRLAACLRAVGSPDVETARRRIQERPALRRAAVDALLLGVTEFFRDPPAFAALNQQLQKWAAPLRIWSVACSDGPELYSVAILAAERELLPETVLLGTDCRGSAIQAAREGVYAANTVRHLDPDLRRLYLRAEADGFRVCDSLRRSVRFEKGDIFEQAAESEQWDLILWRNSAIYLEPSAAERVWSKLTQALRRGGLLMAGRAERPPAHLGMTRIGPCLFRKPG